LEPALSSGPMGGPLTPVGATTITCVKGCTLAWVERGVNPNSQPLLTFSYRRTGPTVERCSSGKVGGWITANAFAPAPI